MTDLDKLIEAVEMGKPDWGATFLDARDTEDCPFSNEKNEMVFGALNGSLDAAKALHDALIPEWDWVVGNDGGQSTAGVRIYGDADFVEAGSNNPARAWLLAILKAYQAQQVKE